MTIKKMINQGPNYKPDKRLWQNIAFVAGIFSFVICVLIIVNYLQINRIDPVETETIDALVSRLQENPQDDQLREQIRTLDLLARKAYFTSQWQIRMGGYLLLIGVIIVIIAFQMMAVDEKKKVDLKPESKTNLIYLQKQTRRWVTGFSAVLVVITLAFAFLTYRQLGDKFDRTLVEISRKANENEIPGSNEQNTPEPFSEQIDQSDDLDKRSEETAPEPGNAKTETIGEPEALKDEPVETKQDQQPVQQSSSDIAAGEETAEESGRAKSVGSFSSDSPGFDYTIPYPESIARNFNAFRGPGGNGVAFQENIPVNWNGETGENILWKTEIPLEGFNSPVIWGNKLLLTGADKNRREVYCIDTDKGEILWTVPVENVPGSPATTPDVPDYTGYAASTGTTDGKYFFAIFANADVAAFDFEGNLIWSRNLGAPDNHYGYSSSLLVYNDKLIIQWDQRNVAKVLALSTENGQVSWETERDVKISWASPVIAHTSQGAQLILAADPFVIGYNPDNGKELWRLKCLSGEVGPSVAVGGDMVFALNEYASLVGIRLGEQPEKVWEDYDYLSDVPSPVATDKYLIVSTSYGVIACYGTESGEKFWEAEFDNSIYASPVIADGKVYLIDKQGEMHIFRAGKEYVHIADSPLGEGSVCTPAFSDGRVYIRGDKHLFCIGE